MLQKVVLFGLDVHPQTCNKEKTTRGKAASCCKACFKWIKGEIKNQKPEWQNTNPELCSLGRLTPSLDVLTTTEQSPEEHTLVLNQPCTEQGLHKSLLAWTALRFHTPCSQRRVQEPSTCLVLPPTAAKFFCLFCQFQGVNDPNIYCRIFSLLFLWYGWRNLEALHD